MSAQEIKPGDRVHYDDSQDYRCDPDIFEGIWEDRGTCAGIVIVKWIQKSFYSEHRYFPLGSFWRATPYRFCTLLPPLNLEPLSMIPIVNRLVYDDRVGQWRVLFGGKLVKQTFPNNTAAFVHLRNLIEKRAQPEYPV